MRTVTVQIEYSEGDLAFLQQRVARFGLYGSLLGWFFFVFRLIQDVALGEDRIVEPAIGYHALAAGSLLAIWVSCRFGRRTERFIRGAETLGTVLACTFYSVMALYIPHFAAPNLIATLALGLGLVARGVYVPSSGRRTLLLTAVCGVPLLVATYYMYRDLDLDRWSAVLPDVLVADVATLAWNSVFFTGAWWLCITFICWGASRVIYGLRAEVDDIRRLGQYTLDEQLGEGGMGIVYRASHAMLRRPTAVKLLPPHKTSEETVARFEREVQLTARLTHPNTVTIFDYGRTPEGIFYYAMEMLDGASLADIVEIDGPQPAGRVILILEEVAGALAEAHAANLIHRDVKPANIMLVEQGGKPDVAKVLDFGLVREIERLDQPELTGANQITGTPQYLAPEAMRRPNHPDPRSDIYALACVGYFLLTGEHAFNGDTVVEVCAAHLHKEPSLPSTRAEGVPRDLEQLILRCLAKNPDDRPQSVLEVEDALQACADHGTWTDVHARTWWNEHREMLEKRKIRKRISGDGLTMMIALSDRGDLPSRT